MRSSCLGEQHAGAGGASVGSVVAASQGAWRETDGAGPDRASLQVATAQRCDLTGTAFELSQSGRISGTLTAMRCTSGQMSASRKVDRV